MNNRLRDLLTRIVTSARASRTPPQSGDEWANLMIPTDLIEEAERILGIRSNDESTESGL